MNFTEKSTFPAFKFPRCRFKGFCLAQWGLSGYFSRLGLQFDQGRNFFASGFSRTSQKFSDLCQRFACAVLPGGSLKGPGFVGDAENFRLFSPGALGFGVFDGRFNSRKRGIGRKLQSRSQFPQLLGGAGPR